MASDSCLLHAAIFALIAAPFVLSHPHWPYCYCQHCHCRVYVAAVALITATGATCLHPHSTFPPIQGVTLAVQSSRRRHWKACWTSPASQASCMQHICPVTAALSAGELVGARSCIFKFRIVCGCALL